jgi:hypothetical protein
MSKRVEVKRRELVRKREVKCLLCVGHSDHDVGYVSCPRLRSVICFACCVEISYGAEDTRKQVMKQFNLEEKKIDVVCEKCQPKWVKRGKCDVLCD